MAKRRFVLTVGQSNNYCPADYASWIAAMPELDLSTASTLATGSYNDLFACPGNYPGFGTVSLKGRAVHAIRYLSFYNPTAAGNPFYPGEFALVTPAGADPASTSTSLAVYAGGFGQLNFEVGTYSFDIVRHSTGATHTVSAVVLSGATIYLTTTGVTNPVVGERFTYKVPLSGTPVSVDSGTADPAVTTAATYLDDSRAPFTVNEHIGRVVECGGRRGRVVSNTTARLNIVAWDGATPANGLAWNVYDSFAHTTTLVTIRSNYFDLTGIKLTCVSGTAANLNQSRVITGWTAGVSAVAGNALCKGTATFDVAWPATPVDTDRFILEPQHGGTFSKHALWLPWTPLEGDLTAGRTNPYPRPFQYPSVWTLPGVFWPSSLSALIPPPAPVTVQGITTSRSPLAAQHTTMALRLREALGEEIYVINLAVGGSTLAHAEGSTFLPTDGYGWLDFTQQNNWMPGEQNNLFARLSDTLDAAIAAAALEGDTLEVLCVNKVHGETDGTREAWANAYESNLRKFKAAVRDLLVAKGLWTKPAEAIPWIQAELSEELSLWPYAATINAAIRRVAAEDRYMRLAVVSDLPKKGGGDLAHYSGAGMVTLGTRHAEALLDLLGELADSGEVSLCNLALAHIGDPARVTAINPPDGSVQASLCATYYPIARDSMLEKRNWSFATSYATLVAAPQLRSEWRYAYYLPSNVLTVTAVHPPEAGDDYQGFVITQRDPLMQPVPTTYATPQPFSIEKGPGGVRLLLTNIENARARIVLRITDTRLYTAQFRMALSWHLASLLAGPIVKGAQGAQLSTQCAQRAIYEMGEASTVDAVERQIAPDHVAPWHRYR